MSELKPCPFCGNENVAIANECHDLSGGYFIACPACGGSTGLRYACGDDPRPLLIEQWNRRTARSGQAASGSSRGARSDRTPSQKLADAGFTRRPSLLALQAREALELIAAPQRADGSWNRDREACRQLAAEALGRDTDSDVPNGVGQPEAPTAAPLEPAAWADDRAIAGGIGNVVSAATKAYWERSHTIDRAMAARMVHPLYAHPPARSGAKPAAERTEQEIIRDAVASVRLFRQDYCPEKIKPGGCTLHNLHCGYPKCNEPPAARSGAGSEDAHD